LPGNPRLLPFQSRLASSQHVNRLGHDLDRAQPVLPRSARPGRYGSPVRDTDHSCLPLGHGAAEHHIDEGNWRKASYSLGNGECIEVADGPTDCVAIRDSKNPAGSVLVYSSDEWKLFLTKVKI
jgi:hypothetical protein